MVHKRMDKNTFGGLKNAVFSENPLPRVEKIEKIHKICYVITGSFCTFSRSLKVLMALADAGYDLYPVMSENAYSTDTRFYLAADYAQRVAATCGKEIIRTVSAAEPLGPKNPMDLMIVAPCTGNTLAKVANGITDSAATMAIKAHLRCDRPLLIAAASNDAMSQNLKNIAALLCRRSVFFLPMHQDDPIGKPHSLVAEMERIPEAMLALAEGRELRPLFT